ncbi:hypothetical protein D3C76_1117450 [compost metagenome]
MRLIPGLLQVDAVEGIGQVQVAQAELRGTAVGGAAEQGETPDAVGVEAVALARLEPGARTVAEALVDIAQQLQLLAGGDFGSGVGEQPPVEPGPGQALFDGQSVVEAELRHQLHADGAASRGPVGWLRHGWKPVRISQLAVRLCHNATPRRALGFLLPRRPSGGAGISMGENNA